MRYISIVLFSLLLTGCIKEEALNRPFDTFRPRNINDGLILSSPSAEHIDSLQLLTAYKLAYQDPDLWPLRSLLVFRNNKLVAESYLKDPDDITTQHLLWSSTKQVLGVVTGLAVDRGLISSVDDPISKYLVEETKDHPEKAGITIKQLITMHSGINFNNDGIGADTDKLLRKIPDNMVEYILSLPMRNDPGTDFHYNDGDPHLVAAVIQAAAGRPADDWADEFFFSRIGVTNYNWIRYKDGTTKGGYGIEITPRELAKIALCVADSGRYNNQQIVSEDWMKEMIIPRTDSPWGYQMGYYWWIDTDRGIHFTWGHGGQFAFIIPSKDLVVIMTSIPNTQGDYQVDADEAMPLIDIIINACF